MSAYENLLGSQETGKLQVLEQKSEGQIQENGVERGRSRNSWAFP